MPLHNIDAVATNKYYVVGKMLASCLVQGGQPPVCFAHAVADYLVYDQVHSNPSIEDIPDYEVQQFMLQVWNFNVNILIAKRTGFVHVWHANTVNCSLITVFTR